MRSRAGGRSALAELAVPGLRGPVQQRPGLVPDLRRARAGVWGTAIDVREAAAQRPTFTRFASVFSANCQLITFGIKQNRIVPRIRNTFLGAEQKAYALPIFLYKAAIRNTGKSRDHAYPSAPLHRKYETWPK